MSPYLLPAGCMVLGLMLLVVGGELLVRGASALAVAVRISPLVIGLTVVAFGTSAPELAVGVQSALTGQTDVAIGNVVGSNIANILLILGAAALAGPLVVASQVIRFDVPLVIAASVAMLLMGLDGAIGRLDGCLLFSSLLVYTGWSIRQSRRETVDVQQEFVEQAPTPRTGPGRPLPVYVGLVVFGLLLLAVGSRWFVSGAVDIARQLGVGELVIGLTVVAVGTSLPEVVTSITASVRGQRDIAVGNVVGSSLFNILCVLGASSIVAPEGIAIAASALRFDIPVMIAVALACLPIFVTGHRIDRWEGGLFLGYYAAYTTYLVLEATQSEITRTFGSIMLVFVIPLTVITLIVSVLHTVRGHRSGRMDDGPQS